MAIFQCDLLKNSKNRCIAIATELFFVFFRREKNKHNGASYLFSFTKFDAHSRATQGEFSETYKKKNSSDG